MPIKKENKARYPKNWPEISARIKEQAGNKCQFCNVHDRAPISRGKWNGQDVWQDDNGAIFSAKDGTHVGDAYLGDLEGNVTYCVVILTTAHMDHTPENCADENLKALCQKCHNVYDVEHRKETRKANKKQSSLF